MSFESRIMFCNEFIEGDLVQKEAWINIGVPRAVYQEYANNAVMLCSYIRRSNAPIDIEVLKQTFNANERVWRNVTAAAESQFRNANYKEQEYQKAYEDLRKIRSGLFNYISRSKINQRSTNF